MGRESERGAAMLLVLLILVVSTAIGVLASYSTGQEVSTAGYVRQAAQAQYLAEMGVMSSFGAYVDQQSLVDRDLDGQVSDGSLNAHHFYLQDIEDDDARWPVEPLEMADDVPPGDPHSLGFIAQRVDWVVEFNDGYLDAALVPRERVNQMRRRVRVNAVASLAMEGAAADSASYLGRTSTQQGVRATFSVPAELR